MVSEPVGDYFKPIISIDTFSTFLLVYSRFEGFKQTLKGVHLNDRELRSKNRTEGTWGNAKGLRNFATCALGKTCCALVRNRCFQTSLCSNFISLISLSTYSLVKNALRFFTVYVHTHTHTLCSFLAWKIHGWNAWKSNKRKNRQDEKKVLHREG